MLVNKGPFAILAPKTPILGLFWAPGSQKSQKKFKTGSREALAAQQNFWKPPFLPKATYFTPSDTSKIFPFPSKGAIFAKVTKFG